MSWGTRWSATDAHPVASGNGHCKMSLHTRAHKNTCMHVSLPFFSSRAHTPLNVNKSQSRPFPRFLPHMRSKVHISTQRSALVPSFTRHTCSHILANAGITERKTREWWGPVPRWFNLALTRAAVQDGAWQQFPSDEYLCSRHGGQGSATISCVISESFGVGRFYFYMWKHTCAQR